MSDTRIINKIKYLRLCNENHLKCLSLEDNIYFTLRDIFVNISNIDYCMKANEFTSKLTNNICYEERPFGFTYTNVLSNKIYMTQLNKWLMRIHQSDFDFDPIYNTSNKEEKYNTENLIEFDDWWEHFEVLKKIIRNKLLTL
jgi:hypothetical protein